MKGYCTARIIFTLILFLLLQSKLPIVEQLKNSKVCEKVVPVFGTIQFVLDTFRYVPLAALRSTIVRLFSRSCQHIKCNELTNPTAATILSLKGGQYLVSPANAKWLKNILTKENILMSYQGILLVMRYWSCSSKVSVWESKV